MWSERRAWLVGIRAGAAHQEVVVEGDVIRHRAGAAHQQVEAGVVCTAGGNMASSQLVHPRFMARALQLFVFL